MNKKLLTVAIGTALAAAPMLAAQADAKFYGHAQVEVSSQDSEFNTRDASGSIANPGFDGISLEDRARGRFGFKAKEDLGNGMKGLANFEFRVDTTDNKADESGAIAGSTTKTSGNTIKERVMSVGIQAGWGTILLGNLKSPYKYTGGVKYDAFVATSLEARGNGGMTGNDIARMGARKLKGSFGHNNFLSNSISYQNKFGNFKAWVAFSPDENGDARGSDGNLFASLLYSAGNWEAFVALGSVNDDQKPGFTGGTGVAESYDTVKVGGKFKFGGNMTVYAQIEEGTINDETAPTTSDVDLSTMFLGWRMKMGKNIFVAQYGQMNIEGPSGGTTINSGGGFSCVNSTNGEIDVDYINLGVIHKFTKKTRVWAGYRKTSYDGCTTSVGTGTKDPDDIALSVGIRKDF